MIGPESCTCGTRVTDVMSIITSDISVYAQSNVHGSTMQLTKSGTPCTTYTLSTCKYHEFSKPLHTTMFLAGSRVGHSLSNHIYVLPACLSSCDLTAIPASSVSYYTCN